MKSTPSPDAVSPKPPPGRLARQLIVPLAIIFVVGAALTTGFGYWHERTVHFREFDHKIIDSGSLLQAAFEARGDLRDAVAHVQALTAKLNASKRDEHLLIVRDASGRALSAKNPAILSTTRGTDPGIVSAFEYMGRSWRGTVLSVYAADTESDWNGTILYAEPTTRVEAALVADLRFHLGIGLALLLLLGGCIYWLLRRAVLFPLEALDYHFRVIADGRMEPACYVPHANNEIERIHHHFNRIVVQWRAAQPPAWIIPSGKRRSSARHSL